VRERELQIRTRPAGLGAKRQPSPEELGDGNKDFGAPEAGHYVHPRVPRLWRSNDIGIDFPALPDWADVWPPALRACF
jgi:hypothetical protein